MNDGGELDRGSGGNPETDAGAQAESTDQERRSLLASLLMAGGLAGGYGTFFAMAGRYLFPSGTGQAWMFVADAAGVEPGASIPFVSPAGVRVTITRRSDRAAGDVPNAEDFLALSSVCPHLGCRVSWEPHNNRYFCPCHNGVFDPNGLPVSGPPAADGQELPRYPLQIVDGSLYIEMPFSSVGSVG